MEGGRGYRGWALVWALGLTTIVSYGTTQYFFGLLVIPIQHELGWSRALISGATSISALVVGALGVPIGRLVDRRGARAVMATGSLLGGLGLIACSQVRQPWQFYALWGGVMGLAMALTLYPVTFTVITNWFIRRRGSALALLTVLGGLASPIFIPLGGILVDRIGWRATMVVFGLAQLAIALPIHAAVLRHRPEDLGLLPDGEPRPSAQPRPGTRFADALRAPAFWSLTVALALSWLASTAILAHQVAYLIGRGFNPVLAASVAGGLGVASLPSRYVLNRLSERLSPQTLLAAATLAQAIGVVLLALAARPALVWAYVIVYGAAYGARSPLNASTMADHFGRRDFGAITAASGLPTAAAGAAGPLLMGALYDRLGTYEPGLALVAAILALSAAAVALTPHPACEVQTANAFL